MPDFDWLLFDADKTLFSFESYDGLARLFEKHGETCTDQDFAEYEGTNKFLWVQFQNDKISSQDLKIERFKKLAERFGTSPAELNDEFLECMGEVSEPLEGVERGLEDLVKTYQLAIITNGFRVVQDIRLKRTGLGKYFEFVICSEEAGFAKPHPYIFKTAFEQMGEFQKDRVLMIGDTLDSDIVGAENVGIQSCWLNPANETCHLKKRPEFEVKDFHEFYDLIKNGQSQG